MTAVDPVYARRLMRACERALVAAYGRAAYERMLREAERSVAGAPVHDRGLVVAGEFQDREIGRNTYHAEADRRAAG